MHRAWLFAVEKVSFYLILFLAIPIILEVDNILCLWLSNVPEYTALFTRLVVINAVIESLSYPLSAAAFTTGVKKIFNKILIPWLRNTFESAPIRFQPQKLNNSLNILAFQYGLNLHPSR